MLQLKTYVKYINSLEGLTDGSPLGVYDAEFGDEEPLSALCDEYDPPSCFSTDLFCGVDVPAGNIELGGRHDGWMHRSEENAKTNIGALGGVRKIVSEDESGEVNLEIV